MSLVSGNLTDIENAIHAKLGAVPLHREQMAAVTNIHRAAAAIRQHLENSVLRTNDLTWTGFIVLWVVWIAGEMETRHVAAEAGISKGTLTGVAKTLQSRGLLERAGHPDDGRRVVLRLTADGQALMGELFPRFNDEEAFVADPLDSPEAQSLAEMLRRMVIHLESNGEQRRAGMRAGQPSRTRRSGRRAKQN